MEIIYQAVFIIIVGGFAGALRGILGYIASGNEDFNTPKFLRTVIFGCVFGIFIGMMYVQREGIEVITLGTIAAIFTTVFTSVVIIENINKFLTRKIDEQGKDEQKNIPRTY